MQNTLSVSRRQARAKLAGNFDRFILREPANAAEQGSQVLTVDVFHGEECLAVDLSHVINAADIGMRDAASDADFIAETFEQSFVACGGIGQKLQGDGLAQGEIVRTVNLSHSSSAQQRNDAVTSRDQPAGKESSFH